MNKAVKRALIIGLMAVLYSFLLCACSKPVPIEVQIQEQLDLGNKYLTEMNYEQAVIAFTKAIELDEKNIAAYEGLGSVYMAQNNYSDAIDTYEKLLEMDNTNPVYYHTLSTIYIETGNEQKEIETLEEAVSVVGVDKLTPEDKELLFAYYKCKA